VVVVVVQMEARRKGQSVASYEEGEGNYVALSASGASRPAASKSKAGLGARFLKLVGAGKSAPEQAKRGHREFGKVGHISAAFL